MSHRRYGDANCLTNQVGWNQQLSFFVYVYGTLSALGYLRRKASRRPEGSAERRSCYEQIVLLAVLAYSNFWAISIGSRYLKCKIDSEIEHRLQEMNFK